MRGEEGQQRRRSEERKKETTHADGSPIERRERLRLLLQHIAVSPPQIIPQQCPPTPDGIRLDRVHPLLEPHKQRPMPPREFLHDRVRLGRAQEVVELFEAEGVFGEDGEEERMRERRVLLLRFEAEKVAMTLQVRFDERKALLDDCSVAAEERSKRLRERKVVENAEPGAVEREMLVLLYSAIAVDTDAVRVLESDVEAARVVVPLPEEGRVALDAYRGDGEVAVALDLGVSEGTELADLGMRGVYCLSFERSQGETNLATRDDHGGLVLRDEPFEVGHIDEVERLRRLLIVAEDDDERERDDVDSSEEGGDGEGKVGRVVEEVDAGEALLDEPAEDDDARLGGEVAVAAGVVEGVQSDLAKYLRGWVGKTS